MSDVPTQDTSFSIVKRARSFVHAGRGLFVFIKSTHNAWIHIGALVLVVALGVYFCITRVEWMFLVLAAGFVFAAEAFNTAIEIDIDLTSPEYHPYARDTKDVAAGAVLLSALTALIVGIFIFAPYVLKAIPVHAPASDSAPASLSISYTNSSADDITLELPFPGAVTGKTFGVIGHARGSWFFEASFPVELLDSSGTLIARGIAQAEGDWMTTDFVPFRADITAPESYIGPATLVLRKDNPSGLPEHDASISLPITVEY